MKMIKIDPPGSFCHYEAVFDAVKKCGGKTFLEVGCGGADLSYKLCQRGFSGIGIDFSPSAIKAAGEKMKCYIHASQFKVSHADLFSLEDNAIEKVDLGLSMMVMEHVENDVGFIRRIIDFVKPEGYVILSVPGRRDRWSFEDETVGHLRRYDRQDLKEVMENAGLKDVTVWSVSVPISNLLFSMGNFMIRRSSEEVEKLAQDQRTQTETSGIREIPFKTIFPVWCKLILNRITLYPLFLLQRVFYKTNLGIEVLGFGRVI